MIKKTWVVFQYEMRGLFSNRSFLVMTILLPILGALLLSIPSIINIPGLSAVTEQAIGEDTSQPAGGEDASQAEKDFFKEYGTSIAIFDEAGIIDLAFASTMMPYAKWIVVDSIDELKFIIDDTTAQKGYHILSETEYQTYYYEKGMFESVDHTFESVMIENYRIAYCEQLGLSYEEVLPMLHVSIASSDVVLHTNSEDSYWYSYILTIIVFMVILLYGQMIATAVASEKSNRAMEVLVTSTTPTSLLFGKVFANALAGLIQVGLAMGAILISYRINRVNWGNGALDQFLNIPADVVIVFALFGIFGYLFYAFLFGALGALVSKTEDVSKAMSVPMIIIMFVYIFSLIQATSPEGIILKVLSYLPFSSYGTMFIRVASNSASMVEVVISLAITILSMIGAGMLAAQIYRMGTLRYGNPMKLSAAIKALREKE
ncbi:MAG: ABC transporter permease [Clostridium sp.]|jgi:ABC-2 type transport system permease protein|nr:ABC transporter permease [Clostridium sp.]